MTDTVRETIELAIVDRLMTMREGEPATDPYGVTFSVVTRASIGALSSGKRYVAGVYGGPEIKRADFPSMRARLRLTIEFHILLEKADTAQAELNFLLGEIQRRLAEDHTLGGLAYDMVEESNEFDVDGPFDQQVAGALVYVVQYIHAHKDPRATRNVLVP